jgi:hydroxymethylbilane synthase
LIAPLEDAATRIRTRAERALNAALAGGCQAPVAGYSLIRNGDLQLRGLVGRPDGSEIVHGEITGPAGEAESLGRRLAEDLLTRGARGILDELLAGD